MTCRLGQLTGNYTRNTFNWTLQYTEADAITTKPATQPVIYTNYTIKPTEQKTIIGKSRSRAIYRGAALQCQLRARSSQHVFKSTSESTICMKRVGMRRRLRNAARTIDPRY